MVSSWIDEWNARNGGRSLADDIRETLDDKKWRSVPEICAELRSRPIRPRSLNYAGAHIKLRRLEEEGLVESSRQQVTTTFFTREGAITERISVAMYRKTLKIK